MRNSKLYAIIGAAMTIAAGTASAATVKGKPFDPAVWRTQKSDTANARSGMLSDLEANHLKPGLGQDKVAELLGTPDRQEPGRYVYNLGRGLGPDIEAYIVEFDQSGKLSRSYMKRY